MSNILDEDEFLTPLLTEKENSPQKSKLLGGLLAFLSSLSLNCSDLMFVRFSLQIIVISSIIKYQILRKDTTRIETGINEERSVRLLIFQ